METSEFHSVGGWCFKRLPDGSVRMRKYAPSLPADPTIMKVDTEVVFEPDTWCSVVASVSPGGETDVALEHARKLHGVVI